MEFNAFFISQDRDRVLKRGRLYWSYSIYTTVYQLRQGLCTAKIWLGEASSESDRAIIFLKHVCARLEQAGIAPVESLDPPQYVERDFLRGLGDYLEPTFNDDWEAVAQLFMRPWWTRAWIVQELVAAPMAEFRCGSMTIAWPVVALSISLLAHCKMQITQFPHPFRVSCAMDRAWNLLYIKYDFAVKGCVDFLRLLDHRRRNCADLRDKIYSLLGMTNEFTRARLKPDYSTPVAEVFAAALASDIEEHQDLEVLSFVDHLDNPTEYPSWVADLARTPKTWRFYKYWPPPPAFKWTPASPISFSDDFRTLCVDGYEIDTLQDAKVQDTEEPFQRRTTQNSREWEWTWDLLPYCELGTSAGQGGFVNHQRNANQLNIGPRLINSTEENLIKQPTHSIDG